MWKQVVYNFSNFLLVLNYNFSIKKKLYLFELPQNKWVEIKQKTEESFFLKWLMLTNEKYNIKPKNVYSYVKNKSYIKKYHYKFN